MATIEFHKNWMVFSQKRFMKKQVPYSIPDIFLEPKSAH